MRRKGRGVQKEIQNKFDALKKTRDWSDGDKKEYFKNPKTEFLLVHPKSIINKIDSPDLSMGYSMNPYQGCEHGCIYCYARNSFEYWGFSAGIDFETKILIKRNAPQLLEKQLMSPTWEASPIMLSGNTDCYQPAERKEQITRKCLEVFWKYRHPVSIITKNSLILRDLDLLKQLASKQLVRCLISITSLDETMRRTLEPRTSSVKSKLKTIQTLAQHNVPVGLMLGPIIPGLNDHEIFSIVEKATSYGAQTMAFTVIHLNGHLGDLFTDWIHKAHPTKAKKVLSLIKQMHNGKLNDSRWGIRKRGEGKQAQMIHRQVALAQAKYFKNGLHSPPFNLELHSYYKTNQLNLFSPRES